jgi:Ankyrin repeats (3 copies)
MIRALLAAVTIWIATMAAYYWGLRSMIEWPGNLICAIMGGTFLVVFIGALRGWWQGRTDAALVRRALAGQPLRDGRRTAIAGRLLVTGAALSSPVSGKLCALYEYDVAHMEDYTVQDSDNSGETRSRRVVDLSGVGMAPCVVEGRHGRVDLSGFPVLEPVPDAVLSSAASLDKLARHLEGHPAKSSTGLAKLRGLGELAGVFSHDASAFQMDWRFTKEPVNATDQIVTEKRIESGAAVVVIGRYDAEKRALVGRDGRKASYNLLHLGSPEEVSRQIGKHSVFMLVVAFLFFAVFHTAIAFVLHRTAHSMDSASQQETAILGLAQSGDGAALRDYVQRHGSPETAGPALTRLLCDARSAEQARILLDAGADPNAADPRTGAQPLMTAVRYGNLDTVELLLQRGANPHIEEARTRHSLLFVAYKNRRYAVIPRLEKEGLPETWVTAVTGQPLPRDGGEPFAVCARYLAAVQREDTATMAQLTSRNTDTTYEGVDFEVWKKYRPTHPKFLMGYLRPHALEAGGAESATLMLMDTDPALAFLTWNYHLLHEDGQWKIYAEWSNP